jgi:hypothetical protein
VLRCFCVDRRVRVYARRKVTGLLYNANFDGALLSRGFWLYVWEIVPAHGRTIHYVGKTGDKASRVCQSPFNRLSNHLGGNKHSNALKRHLGQKKIEPERCQFRFHAYGPLFVDNSEQTHGELCDATSGLEKALADALNEAGYEVINKVHCRIPIDLAIFQTARNAFATHFKKLSVNSKANIREFPTEATVNGDQR